MKAAMLSTRIRFALLTVALLLLGNASAVRSPMPPPTPNMPNEQALGFYAAGKLVGATALPAQGPGFVKIFQPRNRAFGTQQMIRVLKQVSRKLATTYPE